jgi:hypothetical protein
MMEQSNAKTRTSTPFQSQPKKFRGKGKASDSYPSKPQAEMKSYTCKHWNNGTCNSLADHVNNDILWRHQCIACFRKGTVAKHKSMEDSCPSK